MTADHLGILLLAGLAAGLSSQARAEPTVGDTCTTYRPADFARARENIARHEWARDAYAWLDGKAEALLPLSRDELRAFVSSQTPLITVACPDCGNGPWYAYDLVNDGAALRCRNCKRECRYDVADTTETWNVQAVLRYHRLDRIITQAWAAGLVYQVDGDERHARQAGVVIERLAEVFPGYRMNKVNANVWLDGNDPYYGKIGGWKYRESYLLKRALTAYDCIRHSRALDSEQRVRIDRDLVAYARDYFLEHFGIQAFKDTPQLQDSGGIYWCVAACGALLGDEATLQRVVDLFERFMNPESRLLFGDGTWYQRTPDYESQFLRAAWDVPEVLRGNISPGIYDNPACAAWERCLTWSLDFLWPDGTTPAINDSHVGSTPSTMLADVAFARYGSPKALRYLRHAWGRDLDGGHQEALFLRDPSVAEGVADESYSDESVNFTGMRVMSLRDREHHPDQTMAILDYGNFVPHDHCHHGFLNLGFFACGVEMISEMGYTTYPRWNQAWQITPIAHNTVVEVGAHDDGGETLLWWPSPGPRLCEAGLPGGSSRFLAMLPRADGPPLLIDIFRARGSEGPYHWALHGRSADLTVEGIGELEPWLAPEPLTEGRQALARDSLAATWTFPGDTPRGLRVVMPNTAGATVLLSQCPPEEDAIKAVHGSGGILEAGATIPTRGHLQVVRDGPEAVFVAAHAPFSGEAPDVTVRQHAVGDGSAIGLEVACGADEWLILHNPAEGRLSWRGLSLTGRAAVAALRDGALLNLTLAEGCRARYEGRTVKRKKPGNGYWGFP